MRAIREKTTAEKRRRTGKFAYGALRKLPYEISVEV